MIEAAFFTANRLFGLSFSEREACRLTIPTHDPGRSPGGGLLQLPLVGSSRRRRIEAFEERGDIFDLYSSGFSRESDEAYKAYRGRAAKPGALLRKRGLAGAPKGEA
jgi:Zn-dependent oligopeptidase